MDERVARVIEKARPFAQLLRQRWIREPDWKPSLEAMAFVEAVEALLPGPLPISCEHQQRGEPCTGHE